MLPHITNQVASPVKVAEYLRAGLKVIISPKIGDYTELIRTTKTSKIWEVGLQLKLPKITNKERKQLKIIVEKYLSKESEANLTGFKNLLGVVKLHSSNNSR